MSDPDQDPNDPTARDLFGLAGYVVFLVVVVWLMAHLSRVLTPVS